MVQVGGSMIRKEMLRQMSSLADQGLLMHFVGMLTDSRSFISYSRHDLDVYYLHSLGT